jgi:hypothetical protein
MAGSKAIDFYALSRGVPRKPARNLIETAQRKSQYIRIIEPLDKQAKEKDEAFKEAYSRKVNLLTAEFLNQFCENGQIDWQTLIKFVSSKNL